MADHSAEGRVELTTFGCKECYVYRPPAASSIGHRAEFWDVDHWLQEVALRIVTCDEECTIRLLDQKSDQLFAECVVPPDMPLSTVVEAVVDSSRYFAIRIVDRLSNRHAIIGIGFRERTEASDFNAALFEHTQYLRRKKQAAEMHEAYTARADAEGGTEGTSQTDMSLKPGETITLKLAKTQLAGPSTTGQGLSRLNSNNATLPQIQVKESSPGHIPLLAPPPALGTALSSSSGQLPHAISGGNVHPDSAQAHAPELQRTPEAQNVEAQAGSSQGTEESCERDAISSQDGAISQPSSRGATNDAPQTDDWGDFIS